MNWIRIFFEGNNWKQIKLWLCEHLGWHTAIQIRKDPTGFQWIGKCPTCGKVEIWKQ